MDRNAITSDLTSQEKQVVKYLQEDWEKRYRVTNIKQGIEGLGLAYTDEMRLRIGAHLKLAYAGKAVFSKRLEEWGPETFILTNEEKLVARCFLLNFKRFRTVPTEIEIAQAVDLDGERIDIALDVLYQLGFIDKHGSRGHIRYELPGDYDRFLRGLGLTFHTVILGNGEKFNVQCSVDALILATGVYADQNVSIDDSCFHCLDKVQIVTMKGKIIPQNSQTIRLYEGTGCGSTNFFSSEEHFQEWITDLLSAEAQRLCGSEKKKSIPVGQFQIQRFSQ